MLLTDPKDMESFAKSLRKLMKERNLSVKKLAEHTGIPRTSLNDWSQGGKPIVSHDLFKLAQYFGVSLEELLLGKDREETIFKKIINTSNSEFTQIFSGVYKISIEKKKDEP